MEEPFPWWTVNADLQSALTSNFFTTGIVSRDDSPDYYIIFDGWNELQSPYLTIEYWPPGSPTPTPTQTPSSTPTPLIYSRDYAAICIRTYNVNTGVNADIDAPNSTTSSFDIQITVQNTGLLDEGVTVTVTDPGFPEWSAVGFMETIPPGACAEISVFPDWPDFFHPIVCGHHSLIATLSDDDNPANNIIEKGIEIPDTTYDTGLQVDSWDPGEPVGNALYYDTPDELIIAAQFTALQTCRINHVMVGILNSKYNQFGWSDWPDASVDQFGLLFMRNGGGEPLLPAESQELNLYATQDSIGHFTVVQTYWAPECSLTISQGETFYIGFKNLNNCAAAGSGDEAICVDNDGLANGYFWVYDRYWINGSRRIRRMEIPSFT